MYQFVDANHDEENCHGAVEPLLKDIELAVETADTRNAVGQHPRHGDDGKSRGDGIDNGQEIASGSTCRHGYEHTEVEKAARGTESEGKKHAEHQAPP